jgi:hypothetical protein
MSGLMLLVEIKGFVPYNGKSCQVELEIFSLDKDWEMK